MKLSAGRRISTALVMALLHSAACIPWRSAGAGTRVTAQRPVYLGHVASIGAQQRVPGEGASVDLTTVPMCREARWQTTFRRERRSISTQGFAGGVFTGLGGVIAVAGGIGALQEGQSLSTGEIDGAAIAFLGGAALAAVGVVLLGIAAADPHDTNREAGHRNRATWIGEPTACRPDGEDVPAEPPGLSVALEAGDAPPMVVPPQELHPRGLRWSDAEWQTLLAWSRECGLAPAPTIVIEAFGAAPPPRFLEAPPATPPSRRALMARYIGPRRAERPLRYDLSVPALTTLPMSPLLRTVRMCIDQAPARCEQGNAARCDQAVRHAASAERAEAFQQRANRIREVQCTRASATGSSADVEACSILRERAPDAETRARYQALQEQGNSRQSAIAAAEEQRQEAERRAEAEREEAARRAQAEREEAARRAQTEQRAVEQREAAARVEAQRQRDIQSMRRNRRPRGSSQPFDFHLTATPHPTPPSERPPGSDRFVPPPPPRPTVFPRRPPINLDPSRVPSGPSRPMRTISIP